MRILVLSDSHGDISSLRAAIKNHPSAEVVVFLGDGERDLSRAQNELEFKHLIAVKGNCDFYSELPENVTITIEGKKLFITHGYAENVKLGDDRLIYKAEEQGADIILYGHTHVPVNKRVNSINVFNPGSLKQGSYGFIDITDKGTIFIHAKI